MRLSCIVAVHTYRPLLQNTLKNLKVTLNFYKDSTHQAKGHRYE
jgi:hypothetical protein